MGEGVGVQRLQRAGKADEVRPAQRVALLPFAGGGEGQFGLAHARKAPQHMGVPLFVFQFVQQVLYVLVAALHLVIVQRACILGKAPYRRRQAAAPLIHLPRHLFQRDAFFGGFLCGSGQQRVHLSQQGTFQPGRSCLACGQRHIPFQEAQVPLQPQIARRYRVQQGIEQPPHRVNVGRRGRCPAVLQFRCTEARCAEHLALRPGLFVPAAAEVQQGHGQDRAVGQAAVHKEIACADVAMDAAAAILIAVDAFQVRQQGAEQIHRLCELRHRISAARPSVAERMIRTAGLGGFFQQIFQPEALPLGKALHFQNAAVRRRAGVFSRQLDRPYRKLSVHRHREPGALAALLPDADLAIGPLVKKRLHLFNSFFTLRIILRQGCGFLRQNSPAHPDITLPWEMLLEDDRIHLPFFLRLIEQRKAARRDVLLDRKPSVLRAQHRSIGQRHTARLLLVPHEKPSSVWIFWLYYSVSSKIFQGGAAPFLPCAKYLFP